MNSILQQELIDIKSSVNYWLGIGWISAIIISILAVGIVIYNKNMVHLEEEKESSNTSKKQVKGFKK
tara:strand:- start:160 stop:360 length:201 start_codon:yes stop_codon:yes gene_type:complete